MKRVTNVHALPPCRGLGRQCRELKVTLRIADLYQDPPAKRDALATWVTGHTERMSFGELYVDTGMLVVDAVIRVPCKYLRGEEPQNGRTAGRQRARCAAHGFAGRMPEPSPRRAPPAVRRADGRLSVIHRRRRRWLTLGWVPAPKRALPVLGDNPCVGAPCRTADNRRGAACCRDLTLDVVIPEGDDAERLLRARRPPYVYEVTREEPGIVECQVISACGYLEDDGISCALHDRVRPDGEPAKPFVCTHWPDSSEDYATHPGCWLAPAGGEAGRGKGEG